MKSKGFVATSFALGCAAALLGARPCAAAALSGSFGPSPTGQSHLWGYASWSRSDSSFWELDFYDWGNHYPLNLASGDTAGSHVGNGDAQFLAYLCENALADPPCSLLLVYDTNSGPAQIYSPTVGQDVTTAADCQGFWTSN